MFTCRSSLLALAVATIAVSLSAQQTQSEKYAARIYDIRPAVVQVSFEFPGPRIVFSGSGFIVDSGGVFVVTNMHVIKPLIGAPAGATPPSCLVGIPIELLPNSPIKFSASFQEIPCTVAATDIEHDVAILKLAHDTSNSVRTSRASLMRTPRTTLSSGNPIEGTEVLVSGYPLSSPQLVTHRGMVSSFSEQGFFLIDAKVNPGNSGGPVYSVDDGSVLGICQAYVHEPMQDDSGNLIPLITRNPDGTMTAQALVQNSGMSQIVPIKFALELMEKNHISPASVSAPRQRAEPLKTPPTQRPE